MAAIEPRIQAPDIVASGDIFEIRTIISHPMETGLRKTAAGAVIPRKIINTFRCRYNGVEVFSVDLHEAMAQDPYLSFYVRAGESGALQFSWEEDGGAVVTLEKKLTVKA